MDISVSYVSHLTVNGFPTHSYCENHAFVNTNNGKKYIGFCKRISILLDAVYVHAGPGERIIYSNFKVWIKDISFNLPEKVVTSEELKDHIEYCIDMYEAFYVE